MSSKKTEMTIQHAEEAGHWIVSVNTEWNDEEFISFSIRHPKNSLSVGDLERSALAAVRDRLSRILEIERTIQQ